MSGLKNIFNSEKGIAANSDTHIDMFILARAVNSD